MILAYDFSDKDTDYFYYEVDDNEALELLSLEDIEDINEADTERLLEHYEQEAREQYKENAAYNKNPRNYLGL